jgi:hypothetical protein
MAEKSLVNEVAESVGTAVGVCDELVEVDVFFEQAVNTTARARTSARTVLGRWSFMDLCPLCLLPGLLDEGDTSEKKWGEDLRSAGATPEPPLRSLLWGRHLVVFPLYFSAAATGSPNCVSDSLEGTFFQ